MSFYILHERIKLDYWTEFKAVYQEIKAIAETVRREHRRVKKPFTTTLVVYKIKDITTPLSHIFNYRYADDTLRHILTSTVQSLHRLALEIESFSETRFVADLRRLATTLVSFLTPGEGVQLTLFDAEKYHDPQAAKKKLPGFFKWWNYRLLNRLGFSNPYKNTKIDYTQLSIKGLWQRQEERRMNFIRKAFFNEPEVASPQETETATVSLADLGLRQLRNVASRLGIPQKVNGKDRSKSSLIGELEGLMEKDRSSVSEAIYLCCKLTVIRNTP